MRRSKLFLTLLIALSTQVCEGLSKRKPKCQPSEEDMNQPPNILTQSPQSLPPDTTFKQSPTDITFKQEPGEAVNQPTNDNGPVESKEFVVKSEPAFGGNQFGVEPGLVVKEEVLDSNIIPTS